MGKTYEVLEKQDRERKTDTAEKLTAETKIPLDPAYPSPGKFPPSFTRRTSN
jgi:hypothetical protein